MTATIRAAVFETNSSSMHALTFPLIREENEVNLKKLRFRIKLTYDSTSDFDHMGGGDLYSVRDKITYVWCAICQHMTRGNEWAYDAEKRIRKWLPNCTFVLPKDKGGELEFYINHQSSDVMFVREMMKSRKLFDESILYGTIRLWSDCCEVDNSQYSRVMMGWGDEDDD
ncbi:MAG: hypothetical protein FWG58_04565 [Methanomassiliicoccaceae archaeon]|nr:hypothetical protein [Methanomassiliicoccaceae archaeon]